MAADLSSQRICNINRGSLLPGLLLINTLEHGVFPNQCLLRVDGPGAHHDVLVEKFRAVQGSSDCFLHVVSLRVHGTVSSDESVNVLLDEGEKLGLSQAGPVGRDKAPENLDQKRLQLLDKVELS